MTPLAMGRRNQGEGRGYAKCPLKYVTVRNDIKVSRIFTVGNNCCAGLFFGNINTIVRLEIIK